MQRETIEARPNKNERLKERLFNYLEDSSELPYWQDEAYYSFSQAEIEEVEKATEELYHMCVKAVDHVIKDNRLGEFGVPAHMHDYVTLSFNRQDPTIYGRFDFSYDGTKPPKMLEYNADTPTSLYEAAILQWDWLEDRRIQNPGRFSNSDQFNGLHEALVVEERPRHDLLERVPLGRRRVLIVEPQDLRVLAFRGLLGLRNELALPAGVVAVEECVVVGVRDGVEG